MIYASDLMDLEMLVIQFMKMKLNMFYINYLLEYYYQTYII